MRFITGIYVYNVFDSNYSSCRFVFTYNNYDFDEVERIMSVVHEHLKLAYFQYEIGSQGTPHLQGFMLTKKPRRVTELSKVISKKIHYEAAKGTNQQVWDYCHKTDTRDVSKIPSSYYWPSEQLCMQYASQSQYATKKLSLKLIIEERVKDRDRSYRFEPNYVRYKETIDRIANDITNETILATYTNMEFIPFEWQQQCLDLLDNQNNRQVSVDDFLMNFDCGFLDFMDI